MVSVIRWFLFLIVGLPFQLVIYILYPLIWIYYRWWIRIPMKKITESVPVRNDLFEAMLGNEPGPMPNVMHAFFSQECDTSSSKSLCSSNLRAYAYIKQAIINIINIKKNAKI